MINVKSECNASSKVTQNTLKSKHSWSLAVEVAAHLQRVQNKVDYQGKPLSSVIFLLILLTNYIIGNENGFGG